MKRESLVGEEIEITILSLGFSLFFGFGGRVLKVKKNGKRESLVSALHGSFVLLYSHLASSIEGKIFLSHSYPLGPHEAATHPVKLYFLLICPATITIFFNKLCFINENILEITTKFISSNQTIF